MSNLKEDSYLTLLRILKLIPKNLQVTKIVFKINLFIMKNLKHERRKYLIQQIIDSLYCEPNVLAISELPSISVAICCTQKDLRVLSETLNGLLKFCLNPIRTITIISPNPIVLPQDLNLAGAVIENICDSNLITPFTQRIIKEVSPTGREGWVTQQVLKFLHSMQSNEPNILVIDADTILRAPHAFVDKFGTQILAISYESHSTYASHASAFLESPSDQISYVTHYQLWQKRIINELFPNGERDLHRWIAKGDFRVESAISEFHTYGSYLRFNHQDIFRIVSWSNLSVPYKIISENRACIQKLNTKYGNLNSVSMHSYLD